MIIVKRETFLLFPPGTLYSRYEPCIVSSLEIKGNSIGVGEDWGGDWFYQDILGETGICYGILDDYEEMEAGIDVELKLDVEQRDGGFRSEELFLIYSLKDIQTLITRIKGDQNEGTGHKTKGELR